MIALSSRPCPSNLYYCLLDLHTCLHSPLENNTVLMSNDKSEGLVLRSGKNLTFTLHWFKCIFLKKKDPKHLLTISSFFTFFTHSPGLHTCQILVISNIEFGTSFRTFSQCNGY
jgi:hypothetical protein